MANGTHKHRRRVTGRSAQPVELPTPCGSVSSRSQGTDSVRGTWSSEGDAGHHPPFPTNSQGTSSPTTVRSRLEWIATQAQKYPHTAFAEVVRAHCRGKVVMYRYADDFVIGCELATDARRIMKAIPQRFARYGLEINREKTKLVDFRQPPWGYDPQKHGPKPDTFSFLGFTHYWGKTWKGGYTIKLKTETKRMFRAARNFWQWCRDHRHLPLEEQYATLCAKLRGYYRYYGVRCNSRCLEWVFQRLKLAWLYWLNRRGGRKKLSWQKYQKLLKAYRLPRPKIMQS
jgi:hypothetical protein